MIGIKEKGRTGAYEAPLCAVLALEGQPICETSLTGNEIEPGTGDDWGIL